MNFCPSCGEDLRGLTSTSDTMAGQQAGRIIDGRYKLLEKLGEGGMGTVFKVEHVRMGKILALKLLRPDLALDKKIKNRFIQEARLVSRLSHPNTIQVFDFGELDDASLYIAMEYLPGRDLAWVLRSKGTLSQEKTISIGAQVLSSLAEAHDNNIIHRDIKPANVMLVQQKDRGDWVKVLDFGIAKLNDSESRKLITGAADLLGTPQYMSPEQAKGEELDSRSDLYSLGAMLFELVTGRGVFEGPTPISIVTKHMTESPPRFSDICPDRKLSAAFERAILRSLEKDRAKRFNSAAEMRAALLELRNGGRSNTADFTPIPSVNPSQVARREDFEGFERALRIRRVLVPTVAVALLSVLIFLGWNFLQQAPNDNGPRTAEIEPNNEPEQATRIGLGLPVTGTIGKPVSETESDRDVFVLEIPQRMSISVDLTAVPDMNLVFELFQVESFSQDGKIRLSPRLVVDDAPEGQAEHVDAFVAAKGPLYVRVQERHYFTEAVRPPREKTNFEYKLTVSPTVGPGHFEEEPNDTPEHSTPLTARRALSAFTGAPIRYERAYLREALSTADFFSANDAEVEAVIIVPPSQGTLLAVDSSSFQTWKEMAARGNPRLPPATTISGKSALYPLRASARGIRLQPTGPTRPGSPYFLAAVARSPTGLAAALQLVQILKSIHRDEQAADVLKLAKEAFPQSTQLAELERAVK